MNGTTEQFSTVILVTHEGMGKADADLQYKLARTYFHLLGEHNMLPGAICFYTDGVKLVCESSPILEQLEGLAEKGVPLIVCQTCLNHFGLADKMKIGIVGGMSDIIDAQWRAEKVITL